MRELLKSGVPIVTVALFTSGCSGMAGYVRKPGDPEYKKDELTFNTDGCESLRAKGRFWGALSIGLATGTGAASLSTVVTDSKTRKNVFAITTAGLAAIAAMSAYLSSDYGEERKRHKECP